MTDRAWWQRHDKAEPKTLEAALVSPGVQVGIASPWAVTSSLEAIAWADILNTTLLPMTRAEAMSVPAIAKARHVVAPRVASTPLHVFRFARDPATGAESDTQLGDPKWISRTDDGVSPWHRMLWTVDDLIFHGWSLWGTTRGSEGELLGAARVPMDAWQFNSAGQVEVKTPGASDFKPPRDVDVILIPGPHEGILTYGATTVRHARQLLKAAATAGQNPSANLELHQVEGEDLTDVQITALIDSWAAARRGENGGVAYTNKALQLIEHGAIDAHLLIEGRNASAVDCARVVGVAAAMVDATVPKASLTYETTEGRGLEHLAYGVEPYADAIAARLSLDDVVPRGQRTRFDITQDLGPTVPSPTGPVTED